MMENLPQILAKNLRKARNLSSISQEDLADAAQIDRTYVSGIEQGKRNPTIDVVGRCAVALNTTAATLLTKNAFDEN